MDDTEGNATADWPFSDPPNVATVTSRHVIDDKEWIHCVSHEEDDGCWQFHCFHGAPDDISDGLVIGLKNMVDRDPTLIELADLPCGWVAWRDAPTGPWQRARA